MKFPSVAECYPVQTEVVYQGKTIFIGLILAIFADASWVSLLPGAFVDLFSGTMIYLVNKSSENKQKYFENLTIVEHEERIIELINTSENVEFKEKMINKIVDRHCRE